MFLAIDVGNTHCVLGLMDLGEEPVIHHVWRVSTYPMMTEDEFLLKLRPLLGVKKILVEDLDHVVVSSVVPNVSHILKRAFSGKQYLEIDSQWPFGFEILAQPANQVGADRLVNAEAALKRWGAPLILIDSGTATTVCGISREKAYLGGAIMPGMEMSMQSLAQKTAKLFSVDLRWPERTIGRNTQEALQSGILCGYASMLEGMIERFKKELGSDGVRVVATGGVAERLKPYLHGVDVFDPDLTLKGIGDLYQKWKKNEFKC